MLNQKTSYLSLDLWDTVLRRTCHPDEVKLYTAQRMLFLLGHHIAHSSLTPLDLLHQRREIEYQIGLREIKKGFDDEYEIEEVLDLCITRATGNTLNDAVRQQIKERLVESEIKQEISVSYFDKDLFNLLNSWQYEQIIIISDFYMSADKIKRILQTKSFPVPIDHFFLSCDSRLNKRSGRLFQYAHTQLQVKQESILHVGDNKHTDVEMAKKNGMRAYHFSGTAEHASRVQKEAFFSSRCNSSNQQIKKLLQKNLPAETATENQANGNEKLFQGGIELSIIFTGFALFINELCSHNGHRHVHFFTREGIFLKKIFDRVQEINPYRLPSVTSHLLPVSRLSTFLPSMREISCDEMMRLWSQYSNQSINSLFSSLGLMPSDYHKFFQKYAIEPGEMIKSPWQDHRIIRLFNNQNFIKKLTGQQKNRKTILKRFFKAMKFGLDSRAFIVDIGWRGTIQDNIALIYPEISIDGAYLGLQKFFNEQPPNTTKHAYLANANNDEQHPILYHVMPLEMLCYGSGGSAVGYRENDKKEIGPIYKSDEEENRFHSEWITHFQEGVLAATDSLCHLIQQHGISIRELQAISIELAAQFICNPPPAICKVFFSMKQDDTFGMNRVIYPGRTPLKISDKLLGYIWPKKRRKFLQNLEESGWPQGILRYRYGGILYHIGRIKNNFP